MAKLSAPHTLPFLPALIHRGESPGVRKVTGSGLFSISLLPVLLGLLLEVAVRLHVALLQAIPAFWSFGA